MTRQISKNNSSSKEDVPVSSRLDMSLDDLISLSGKGRMKNRRNDGGRTRIRNMNPSRRMRQRFYNQPQEMLKIEGVDRDNMSEGEIPYQQPFRRRFKGSRQFPLFFVQNNRSRNFIPTEGRFVHVSGLDYSIMTSDLQELFESVGPVEKCWVDFDRTDRSLGTGGVIFQSRTSAQRAIEMFNGRLIDEQPLQLHLVTGRLPYRH